VLILEPDGLGVVTGAASIRQLPFGSDFTVVRNVLTATLGTLSSTSQTECGQGPRLQLARHGFTALFDGTRFVGWFDGGRSGLNLTTADGLGVGSTLGAVRSSAAGVKVTSDTLGPEFSSVGGLGGLLDGTSNTSKVTSLWAGESCFFR
jgi:hypothetical protein